MFPQRITEWLNLEGSLKVIWFNPSAQARPPGAASPGPCPDDLNSSKDRDSQPVWELLPLLSLSMHSKEMLPHV